MLRKNNVLGSFNTIRIGSPSFTITTDASTAGWGAVSNCFQAAFILPQVANLVSLKPSCTLMSWKLRQFSLGSDHFVTIYVTLI